MQAFAEFIKDGVRYAAVDAGSHGHPFAQGITEIYRLGGDGLAALWAETPAESSILFERIRQEEMPIRVDTAEIMAFKPVVPFMPAQASTAMVSGFGLTHKSKMAIEAATAAARGLSVPAWFFKGLGTALKAPGDPIRVPAEPMGLCEEAEVVAAFGIGVSGTPHYLGYTFGNDLTDISRVKAESRQLSYAKLIEAGIARTGFLDQLPRVVTGTARIERCGQTVWKGPFCTGLDALAFRVDAIIEHLMAHPTLCTPGTVHYVFLGADRNSVDEGSQVKIGDTVTLAFSSHGVEVTNPVEPLQKKADEVAE